MRLRGGKSATVTDVADLREFVRTRMDSRHRHRMKDRKSIAVPPQCLLPWDQGIYIGKYTQKRNGPMGGGTGELGGRTPYKTSQITIEVEIPFFFNSCLAVFASFLGFVPPLFLLILSYYCFPFFLLGGTV